MDDIRQLVVFLCQAVILLAVVLTSLYNLSMGDSAKDTLWTALLSASIGIISPCPKLKLTKRNGNGVDSDITERQLDALVPGEQNFPLQSSSAS